VIFTPSVEFKDSLRHISFEEDKRPDSVVHEDEEEDEGGGGGNDGPVED
jgi:hypothetical protein